MSTKVLIVGSGLSAQQIHEYPYKQNGWTIVAVNHGWMAYPEYDTLIVSSDFAGTVDPYVAGRLVKNSHHSTYQYGGRAKTGFSIALDAGYWPLDVLKATTIGFLGAALNYTPVGEEQRTHIYGTGLDVLTGVPDHVKIEQEHGRGDPNYTTTIYKYFDKTALQHGCRVFNLSHSIETKLPFMRVTAEQIDG